MRNIVLSIHVYMSVGRINSQNTTFIFNPRPIFGEIIVGHINWIFRKLMWVTILIYATFVHE